MTLGIWLFVTIIVFAGNFVLFCFGSKIRRNGQESLFWESLYLAGKRHRYESPQGRNQKIQIAVAGKLASYMDSFYFCCRNCKNNTKINRKKGRGWRERGPLGHPLNPPRLGPDTVLQSCHTNGYSTASSISCILSIPNLDSIFSVACSPVSPFKYLFLWLLNPQSLPSNEASPGSPKTYWRPSSIKVVTLSSPLHNSKLHSIIKRKKWNFRGLSERYELANTRLLWNKFSCFSLEMSAARRN